MAQSRRAWLSSGAAVLSGLACSAVVGSRAASARMVAAASARTVAAELPTDGDLDVLLRRAREACPFCRPDQPCPEHLF